MAHSQRASIAPRLTILMALVMLAGLLPIPTQLSPTAAAGQVTNFGNSGMPSEVNISFQSSGYDTSTTLKMSANSVVSEASLQVNGWPSASGERPRTIGIDVGDDGDLEWAYGGPGNGSFGHLTELSNGWKRVGLNLSSGANNSYSLRLPANASITSANLNISSLSEMTLSGGDIRDSYLHQPNSQFGNNTHKSCNYGNATHVVVGKTQWSNWHNYRGVFWFNLSTLPMATVLDANLSFWVDDVVNHASNGQPVTRQYSYDLHPLLKDWQEGMEVNLPVQQAPGVTWNDAIDNLTGSDFAWSSPGASGTADRGAAVASLIDSPANLEQTWMGFNSTTLTDLVQGWANGSVQNRGLLMVGDETTNKPQGSMIKITSSENSSHSPRLHIVFEGSDDVTAGIDVGDDGSFEWSHAGPLGNGSSIPDISATLNSLLANATTSFVDDWGNEFVDIQLNITGNATLVIGDIDIRYDWSPTITTSQGVDFASELNQHLTNLTADSTGNVTIPINVSSGSGGVIQLSQLLINTGDRAPSIGSFILPTETMLPDGRYYTLGLELTSYQGLSNLSWVALTPQLADTTSRPTLIYSHINGTAWVDDTAGFISNISSSWQALNQDTGRMEWSIQVSWDWLPAEDILWEARVGTIDSLHTERISTATTDHERRVEIDSFNLWDETVPTMGGPEIFDDEWVAGADSLRVSGTVRFLNESNRPLAGEVQIELENVSGNGSIDSTGAFSIQTQAPNENRYSGFTITASIVGNLDRTPNGLATRTFKIDATLPGLQVNSPTGQRVLPSIEQLFNITIDDTIGIDDGSLRLRWWSEARHDDGDGVAEIEEYGSLPLLRDGLSDNFHATYDDTDNNHGQLVSLFVEGGDIAGNSLLGGAAGRTQDLLHYITLVPSPPTIHNAFFSPAGDDHIVPSYSNWLNVTLNDVNGLEDIEGITIDFGQGIQLDWLQNGELISNDVDIIVESFSLTADTDDVSGSGGSGSAGGLSQSRLHLNVSFSMSPNFTPILDSGIIEIHVSDSSGVRTLGAGLTWQFNADIMLVDYSVVLLADGMLLTDDDYVSAGSRLTMSGRVRYSVADLAPPLDSYDIRLDVPLDSPLPVAADPSGSFSGEMDALGSGLYSVTLRVRQGAGEVEPEPTPVRLILDDTAPKVVANEPNFIAANVTEVSLMFSVEEMDSGLSNQSVPIACSIRRGFDPIGEAILGNATQMLAGEVSRYLVNLSFEPMEAGDTLECVIEMNDLAGNSISGLGATLSWPLALPIVETRPDFIISSVTIFPLEPVFGEATLVNVTIVNIGNFTDESCLVILQAFGEKIANESFVLPRGTSSTTISFPWNPDWLGEMKLMVVVDSDDLIEERNENNTRTVSVLVTEPVKESFLASTGRIAGTGLIGILALIGVGATMMFLRSRDGGEEYEDYSEYVEDDANL